MRCDIVADAAASGDQRGAIRDVEHDATGIALVRELGRERLDGNRIREGQIRSGGEIGVERERGRAGEAALGEQVVGGKLVDEVAFAARSPW